MNELAQQLELIQRFHTVLGDIAPRAIFHPMDPDLKKFEDWCQSALRTKASLVVKDCVLQIRAEIESDKTRYNNTLFQLWSEADLLWERALSTGRHFHRQDIDNGVVLLYLANGMTWHFLSLTLGSKFPENLRYDSVDPLKLLIQRCRPQWSLEAPPDLRQLIPRVTSEMKESFQNARGIMPRERKLMAALRFPRAN